MRQKLRNNGLTIVMLILFALALVGQIMTGLQVYNEQQKDHHQSQIGSIHYLTTGHFVEALFENWESEFLQMGLYVVLTVFLFQKGSSESKDPDKADAEDEDADQKKQPGSPAPIWKGGVILKVYENSLSLALFALFLLSLLLHALGGKNAYNEEQLLHGGQAVGLLRFLATPQFWFQSFQNWQSEFFSIGALVFLSIYLRQKGSPESKAVAAPHKQTGS